MPQIKYFTSPVEFYETVFNLSNKIKTIFMYGETKAAINYVLDDEYVDVLPNTNVVLAAYITAYAHLKLYTYLEQLQERVLYMDSKLFYHLYPSVRIRFLILSCYIFQLTASFICFFRAMLT